MATVRLFTLNLPQSIAFYEGLFGFEKIEQWGPAFAIVRRGDLDLWISGPQTSAAKPWTDGTQPTPGGFTRIVLPLPAEPDFACTAESLGGRIANGPLQGPGGTQLIILDPDGNSIELFEG
jgi:catechol 2,3-dioxygenase-like lactoylglutathione lyase family enzyme